MRTRRLPRDWRPSGRWWGWQANHPWLKRNRERQTALPVLHGKALPQATVRRRKANPATPKANNAKAVGSGTDPSV